MGRPPAGAAIRVRAAHRVAEDPARRNARAYNRLIEARNQRLDSVGTRLPGVMWFVLLPGAMGCLLVSLLFRIEDARYQAMLVSFLAGFMAMVLFVIFSLDRPFQGDMAVTPDSYQLIYDQLMKR